MAFRLKLVPETTNIDFFRVQWLTFGLSIVLIVASIGIVAVKGLNFGVDFLGGTTIRTESTTPVDVGAYREALAAPAPPERHPQPPARWIRYGWWCPPRSPRPR